MQSRMIITLSDVLTPKLKEAIEQIDLRQYDTDPKFLGLSSKDDKIQIDIIQNTPTFYDVTVYFIYMNYFENVHISEINNLIIDTINSVKQ